MVLERLSRHTRRLLVSSLIATAAVGCLGSSLSLAQSTPREVGLWIDDTGRGAVRIVPCGKMLCGQIAWLKDLVDEKGEVLHDAYNPKASLRHRPVCGIQVLGQLQRMSDGSYDNGWVYDPKTGKSYDVAIQLTSPDVLTVTGYEGIKLFGKSFNWTRAKTSLPDCKPGTQRLLKGRSASSSHKTRGHTGRAEKKSTTKEALPWAAN